MVWHWLITSWRSLIANPLFSAITIASLSIGCCGALLAGSVIKQHLSFDRWVPHADRILLMQQIEDDNDGPVSALTPGVRPALEGKIPGVASIVRVVPSFDFFETNPDSARTAVLIADRDYFEVFELPFLEGDPDTALANPDSIVLTRRMANFLFGPGPALGKTVARKDTGTGPRTYSVSGVIADIPPATHQHFEGIVSLAGELKNPAQLNSFNLTMRPGAVYLRIEDGVALGAFMANANRQIGAVLTEAINAYRKVPAGKPQFTYTVALTPLAEIHLGGPHGGVGTDNADIAILVVLGIAALMLLTVSAFNYVTMSLARSLRRRREVAVRKVVGASGGALALHFLAESALVTGISLVIGFGLAELLHPWFARTIGQPETLFQLYDPVFLAISLAAFALLAVTIGAYPSFYLARVRPRTALEEAGAAKPTLLGRTISGGLLGLQIFAATVLLIFALTMLMQARYVAGRPLGFSTRDIVFVGYYCPDGGRSEFAVQAQCDKRAIEIIRGLPGAKRASLFGGRLFRDNLQLVPFSRAEASSELGKTALIGVGPEALDLMKAKLLAGRMFDANSAYDMALASINPEVDKTQLASAPVIVTRAMLRPIGADTPEAAIGQRIYTSDGRQKVSSLEIVGVIEDWHQRSLRFPINPIVFMPSAPVLGAAVEIHPDNVPAAEAAMDAIWRRDMYGMNSRFRWATAASDFELSYERDAKLMAAVASFAMLAILVAGMGVFGLSAFDIRRRVREIGIRKSLGASPGKVAAMVLGQQIVFASVASLLAWPFGYWLANQWLTGYVYRTSLGPTVLPVASLIIIVFVALAVTLNSIRAAAIRPGLALRAT